MPSNRFNRTGVLLILALLSLPASGRQGRAPLDVDWIHGSADCADNSDPAVQVYRHGPGTWVLRQNKCIHYEAPFIYLMLGEETAFMLDSGAVASDDGVRRAVDRILSERGADLALFVAHSHAHGDHVAGDSLFEGRPRTSIVGTDVDSVKAAFGLADWPRGIAEFDLGGRILEILPIPGHEPSHIAVYDRETGLLLTGDTLYPGRLYVREWNTYRDSIGRLAYFARSRPVSWVLGTHVEMSDTADIDYPVGTRYQPDEHPLELEPERLFDLEEALARIGDEPRREVMPSFIVVPR